MVSSSAVEGSGQGSSMVGRLSGGGVLTKLVIILSIYLLS